MAVLGGFICAVICMILLGAIAGPVVPWLVVLGSTIWVGVDASAIGARRGLIKGFGDSDVAGWVIGTFLLWGVVFPAYLMARPLIIEAQHYAPPVPPPQGGASTAFKIVAGVLLALLVIFVIAAMMS